jgi:integral membrane protein
MMHALDPRGIRPSFLRYRVLAFTVGTLLAILVFVGVPLQIWGHTTVVVAVVGTTHGFLYLVYLLASFELMVRARFSLWRLIAMIAAGLVPGLAFLVEHRARGWVAERETALAAASSETPGEPQLRDPAP